MATKQKEVQGPQWPKPQLFPWHQDVVQQLRKAWAGKHLPHALMIQGADGLGKSSLAAWLACAVLCDNSGDELDCCGKCASCDLFAAGSHPDLYWVAPEEGKQQVAIDQVRQACEKLSKTSYRQGYKVAVIEPAHSMTIAAANSVLKTLEEPAPPSLLILLTSQPFSLPATVRSRCQKLRVALPPSSEAIEWLRTQTDKPPSAAVLEFSAGAPLRALDYAQGRFDAMDEQMRASLRDLFTGQADLSQVADHWQKNELEDRLLWLDLWLTSLARSLLTGDDAQTFSAGAKLLPGELSTLDASAIYAVVEHARKLRAQLARTALQRELAVEGWLIAMLRALSPALRSRPAR